jgi:selenocysteine lyase/cysteine desulfurase
MEHNSVARPLEELRKERGLRVYYVPCSAEGFLDLAALKEMIRELSPRLICINHVSNVTGTIQPLAEVASLKGEALLLVDAAQSAGHLEIDLSALPVDFLAFSGHKGLFAPGGIGVLYIREGLEDLVRPLKFGGTGSRSEALEQPNFLPDRFEAGTPNLPGIAGLSAGVEFVLQAGLSHIVAHEQELATRFIEAVKDHPRIKVYGPGDRQKATGIISVNVEGLPPSEVGLRLDREFGIMVRPGLHCAPLAHKTLGTLPQGTVRFSFNFMNRLGEVERAAEALLKIAS